MKPILRLLPLVVALALVGCVTADEMILDSAPRKPTTSVDMYLDGKVPEKKYKEIAEMTFLGPRDEELRAQRRFIGKAQKIGGNGIIFSVTPAGQRGGGAFGAGGGAWGVSTAWLFRGKVIVYE